MRKCLHIIKWREAPGVKEGEARLFTDFKDFYRSILIYVKEKFHQKNN